MPACMSQCSTDLPTRCLIMIISSDMQKTLNPCKRACVMKFILTFNPFCSHWPVHRCDISTAASTAHVTLSVIHTTTSGKQKHTCAGKGQFCCPVSLQKSVAVSQYKSLLTPGPRGTLRHCGNTRQMRQPNASECITITTALKLLTISYHRHLRSSLIKPR